MLNVWTNQDIVALTQHPHIDVNFFRSKRVRHSTEVASLVFTVNFLDDVSVRTLGKANFHSYVFGNLLFLQADITSQHPGGELHHWAIINIISHKQRVASQCMTSQRIPDVRYSMTSYERLVHKYLQCQTSRLVHVTWSVLLSKNA